MHGIIVGNGYTAGISEAIRVFFSVFSSQIAEVSWLTSIQFGVFHGLLQLIQGNVADNDFHMNTMG